ncbi:MAG TPA: hypothetical protein VK853_04330 [Ilumatobacteraceae bacterium]|nr:hypothetical protein [Ilumatobacteraceae bacterium]
MTRRAVAAVAATVILSAGCAETVVEVGSPTDSTENPSTGALPSTTLPIAGSAAELLPEIATELSQLSAQIAGDGDEREALRRIEATWEAARAEVEAQRPDLAGGIQTTVDMARTAVTRIRPADADKAFQILSDLVDRYTGDR